MYPADCTGVSNITIKELTVIWHVFPKLNDPFLRNYKNEPDHCLHKSDPVDAHRASDTVNKYIMASAVLVARGQCMVSPCEFRGAGLRRSASTFFF